MRNEDAERDENEYQYLILPGNPSGSKPEGDAGGKAKGKAEKREDLSLSLEFLDGQKEEKPAEQQADPLASEEARKTENSLPEEPDLEQLARQIREEMERGSTHHASARVQETDAAEQAESEAPANGGEAAGAQTDAAPADEPPEEKPEEPAEEKPEETPEEARIRKFRGIFEYVETFCVALGVMILLFMFVFRYVSVDGDSMLPTLHGGKSSNHADRLIISDFLYEPKTGDVVVISTGTGDKPLIKRVIAAEGQTVRINFKTWEVSVDGVLLQEDYIWRRDGQPMESRDMASMYGVDENGVCEFTVGKGKVFVMGDNRNDSKDSRFREIGEQDVEHILGKVILRLYPLGEFGSV